MNSTIIEVLENKTNELRKKILKKKIFATKTEKELLKKYEQLLLDQYTKFHQ